MIRRTIVVCFLSLSMLSPVLLMGAVCSRAIDIPIVVTANLPNKEDSRGPFELDLDEALKEAGIQPQNGLIPPQAPAKLTLTHQDKFNLRKKKEIEALGSRIHSVYINSLSIEAIENTLSVSLPKIEVGITALPKDNNMPDSKKYKKVAEFPGVPALELGNLPTPSWEKMGVENLQDSLREFALAVQAKTTLSLKPGTPWPKGKIKLRVKFKFAFVLKPI